LTPFLQIDTPDVGAFDRATSNLVFESYNGGRDSKERMSQGLLVALQNASPKSLIVVFTDNGSKDLKLEADIVRLRKAKECEVFIVLTPAFEGRLSGPSLPAYGRMGKVCILITKLQNCYINIRIILNTTYKQKLQQTNKCIKAPNS
jgi:hypothetical protein